MGNLLCPLILLSKIAKQVQQLVLVVWIHFNFMSHLVLPDVHIVKHAKYLLPLGQIKSKYFFMMIHRSMGLILLINIS